MFYAGFDMLFSILFPILFLVVLGMILYTIIGNISTWNKNNHSPRLTVPATVVAKRTEVSRHHTDNTMIWVRKNQNPLQCGSTNFISWLPVLYALKDFLIKRLGSLLEHTT